MQAWQAARQEGSAVLLCAFLLVRQAHSEASSAGRGALISGKWDVSRNLHTS